MKAEPIEIKWHPGLPIFAAESVLKATGDEYGWLGGRDQSGELRFILPYTIIRKSIVRLARFRVETIPVGPPLDIREETSFLNSSVACLRSLGADTIVPATNNAVFRTYPDGADAAPYGTYVIDLTQPEASLWRGIGRITRQNIRTAQKDGVCIRSGLEYLETAYRLIHDTFGRSKLPFMRYDDFKRFVMALGEYGQLMVAEHHGIAHSAVVFAFSDPCVYAVYGGNLAEQHQGANKLIYWEAMSSFRNRGVSRFDFYGARVDPPKGSKHDAINALKQRFGATLVKGYMWKYPLRPWKSLAYSFGIRCLRGGDIVDLERHKLDKAKAIVLDRSEVRA
jgi:GNAT acetyltransferase-like protein